MMVDMMALLRAAQPKKNLSNLWLIYVYLLVLTNLCEVCDASFDLSLIFKGGAGLPFSAAHFDQFYLAFA